MSSLYRLRLVVTAWIHYSVTRLLVSPEKMYWPGDIIVFRRWDNQLVSHRLLAFYRRHGEMRYLTQPDSGTDSPITINQILGKVIGGVCHTNTFHIPLLQRFSSFAKFNWHILARVPPRLYQYYR